MSTKIQPTIEHVTMIKELEEVTNAAHQIYRDELARTKKSAQCKHGRGKPGSVLRMKWNEYARLLNQLCDIHRADADTRANFR